MSNFPFEVDRIPSQLKLQLVDAYLGVDVRIGGRTLLWFDRFDGKVHINNLLHNIGLPVDGDGYLQVAGYRREEL
jgi:hypothetical protein